MILLIEFLNKPVSTEMVKALLEAAMFAPSAGNEQPWQFIVLDDRKLLDVSIERPSRGFSATSEPS
jgi:nitroreductase